MIIKQRKIIGVMARQVVRRLESTLPQVKFMRRYVSKADLIISLTLRYLLPHVTHLLAQLAKAESNSNSCVDTNPSCIRDYWLSR